MKVKKITITIKIFLIIFYDLLYLDLKQVIQLEKMYLYSLGDTHSDFVYVIHSFNYLWISTEITNRTYHDGCNNYSQRFDEKIMKL